MQMPSGQMSHGFGMPQSPGMQSNSMAIQPNAYDNNQLQMNQMQTTINMQRKPITMEGGSACQPQLSNPVSNMQPSNLSMMSAASPQMMPQNVQMSTSLQMSQNAHLPVNQQMTPQHTQVYGNQQVISQNTQMPANQQMMPQNTQIPANQHFFQNSQVPGNNQLISQNSTQLTTVGQNISNNTLVPAASQEVMSQSQQMPAAVPKVMSPNERAEKNGQSMFSSDINTMQEQAIQEPSNTSSQAPKKLTFIQNSKVPTITLNDGQVLDCSDLQGNATQEVQETCDNSISANDNKMSLLKQHMTNKKKSEIICIILRLVWIIYLVVVGFWLLGSGFHKTAKFKDMFHKSLGQVMVFLSGLHLVGGVYLLFKEIQKYRKAVVTEPNAVAPHQYQNPCYRDNHQYQSVPSSKENDIHAGRIPGNGEPCVAVTPAVQQSANLSEQSGSVVDDQTIQSSQPSTVQYETASQTPVGHNALVSQQLVGQNEVVSHPTVGENEEIFNPPRVESETSMQPLEQGTTDTESQGEFLPSTTTTEAKLVLQQEITQKQMKGQSESSLI